MKISKGHIENKLNFAVKNTNIFLILAIAVVVAGTIPIFAEALDPLTVTLSKDVYNKGDVLVVVSASGNSPNVIDAVKQANEMGGKTIGLVGFDGGELLEMCDYVIHAKAKKGEYGPVEDIHMIIDHMVTSFLAFKLMIEKVKAK